MPTHKRAAKPRYRRVLLKLSGEAFRVRDNPRCLDSDCIYSMARQIKKATEMGIELAVVVGGGNIYRGLAGESRGIERVTGDQMGMLATVINALALQAVCEDIGLETRVMTAIRMPYVAEPFIRRRALHHLERGRIVIFGAGTGNPFFTTDSAAALRASEIKADVVLKGTKVDGIYSEDPVKNPKATRYKEVTYSEALAKQLRIMDAAAFSLCMDNHIPIIVFNFFKENEIIRVLKGEPVGTLVKE